MTRLKLAKQAARAGGKAILSVSPTAKIIDKQGRGNFVTAGDLASEKAIVSLIKTSFPDDLILSEETESKMSDQDILSAEHLWVIDPIDGTHNYRYGRNYSAISVGYVEHGKSVMGAVYNPFRNELFFAQKGKGAYLNDQPIRVSDVSDIFGATVATNGAYDPKDARYNLQLFLKIKPTPWVLIRASAVLELCEVACGRVDLYFHTDHSPWDNAAAFVIVKEAGGVITDLKGNSVNFISPHIVVGNKNLVKQFIKRIDL